ncbi:hypothetical protein [Janthinobacterium agaricidamnosum]|uniref:Uncharacterized protein n=1 Tax=Janthinobacterium agaricidamnosum NBRC 102515 = DSM 9628 TaxID=1349767 RepID=W0V2J2_9BURK|nr:hypothetical protein [Janthinobacterium agaricidamnosum]CDG81568.1 hypothetical protein GJA_912 [Janthinobacterium agaricidamnosum NBRC 102515 = DSM 9628]
MSLNALRSDPRNACERNAYITGPKPGSFRNSGDFVRGGPCFIEASQLEAGFVSLLAVERNYNNKDFFYPWLQRGVGWVPVPKNVPDGTIVMTGGVNGCSIVVSESAGHYNFYHDGDSKHLDRSMIDGKEVARVKPNDYDPLGWGHMQFINALSKARKMDEGAVDYGHFVVAVKKDGKFGFYSTGVMNLNGRSRLPLGVSTCIVTF